MPERMRLSDFSPVVGDAYRAGRTVAVPDTAIRGELVAEPEACAAIGVGAWAAVPLLRNGRLAAWIGVHSRTPREWSAADLQTLNEVAERTWGAVERTRAEHALRESEARLRALVGGVPQPVWRSDGEGSWSWASPRWAEYTGRAGEDAGRGHAWLEAVHPGDRAAVLEAWRGARAGGAFRAEHRLWHAAEGRWRWVQSQALPVRGGAEAGRPGDRAAEWIGATTDVEELRRAQEQRILIEELHHRGRNLLAVVAGIADQMLPSCGSLEEFGACFDQRLVALGRVQNLLSREVAPNVTMEELLRLELEAHGVDTDGTGRVQLRGPGVVLPGGSLQMLALALHELTTNALKHGALNNSTGRLDVAWELRQDGTDAPRLRLDWAEIGADLPDNGGAWSRRGFGLELLEVVLPYDLQGETRLEFGRDGLRCSIELPLAQSVTTSVTARG